MVTIPIGNGDFESQGQNISRIRFHNMYMTENPSSIDGLTRISRPTLKVFANLPTEEPVRGVWNRDGAFNNDYFAIAGNTLYRVSDQDQSISVIGEVPGTNIVEFASRTGTDLIDTITFISDGTIYLYDGTDLTSFLLPDDRRAHSLATIHNYFIYSVENAEQFFWLRPGETEVNALNFASAERTPDNIEAIRIIGDEIWFIGRESCEVWSAVSNIDPIIQLPFQRINGRVYSEGCISRETAATLSYNNVPAAIWLSDKGAVILAQGITQRISNESIEELLRDSTNLRCWYFRYNRHDFYVINSDQFGLAFDINNQTWMRWDTKDKNYWRAHLGSQIRNTVIAGDSDEGLLWELEEGFSDDGVNVVREIAGFMPHINRPVPINDVYVKLNAGWAPDHEIAPILELRWSDDQGATWSDYRGASVGTRGNYGTEVRFRSLGLLRAPGRIFEFRYSDLSTFRFDYATINDINRSA